MASILDRLSAPFRRDYNIGGQFSNAWNRLANPTFTPPMPNPFAKDYNFSGQFANAGNTLASGLGFGGAPEVAEMQPALNAAPLDIPRSMPTAMGMPSALNIPRPPGPPSEMERFIAQLTGPGVPFVPNSLRGPVDGGNPVGAPSVQDYMPAWLDNFRSDAQAEGRQLFDQRRATGDTSLSIPDAPIPDDPDLDRLVAARLAPPQTVGTRDRELRFDGMPAVAEQGPVLPGGSEDAAIQRLLAKGYTAYGDTPPAAGGYVGTSQGFFQAPSQNRPGRSIHELRGLDRQNDASQSTGLLAALGRAVGFGGEAPNALSPHEQGRVDMFNQAGQARDAEQDARQALVTRNAQARGLARNMRMHGQAPLLAALGVFDEQGGEPGMPNPALAEFAPRMFAARQGQFGMAQDAAFRDREQEIRAQQEGRLGRVAEGQLGLGREQLGVERERLGVERMQAERAGQETPVALFDRAFRGDPVAQAVTGTAQPEMVQEQILEAEKAQGILTPRVQQRLDELFETGDWRTKGLGALGGRLMGEDPNPAWAFVQHYQQQGWPGKLLLDYVSKFRR